MASMEFQVQTLFCRSCRSLSSLPTHGSCVSDESYICSAPASPTIGLTDAELVCQLDSRTQECNSEAEPGIDEFEFETSQRFNISFQEVEEQDELQQQDRKVDALPPMAFADELFHDGLVLPLECRPHRRFGDDVKASDLSSNSSSPMSSFSVLRGSLPYLSTQSKELDPLMATMDNVRKENTREQVALQRRARCLSPPMMTNKRVGPTRVLRDHGLVAPIKPMVFMGPTNGSPNGILLGPKGHTNLIKKSIPSKPFWTSMDPNSASKPIGSTKSVSKSSDEMLGRRIGSSIGGSNRCKFKGFAFMSASSKGKDETEENLSHYSLTKKDERFKFERDVQYSTKHCDDKKLAHLHYSGLLGCFKS